MWRLCYWCVFFVSTMSLPEDCPIGPIENTCRCRYSYDDVPANSCEQTEKYELSICDAPASEMTCTLSAGTDHTNLTAEIHEDPSVSTLTTAEEDEQIDVSSATREINLTFCKLNKGEYVVKMADGTLCLYTDTLKSAAYNLTLTGHTESVRLVETSTTTSPVTDLNATLGRHNILLSWKILKRQTKFVITYRLYKLKENKNAFVCEENQFDISQLKPDTTYQIYVENVDGNVRKTCVQTTLADLPGEVQNFTHTGLRPHSLSLSWELPQDRYNARCVWFDVTSTAALSESRPHHNATSPMYIADLTPGETYNFSISAVNRIGSGKTTSITVQMPIWAPPRTRVRPRAAGVGAHTVTVELSKASFSDEYGKVISYSVIVCEACAGVPDGILSWRDVQSDQHWRPYQVSAPFISDSGHWNFTVGGGYCCNDGDGFCNGPLKPDTEYCVYLRAFTVLSDVFTDTIAVCVRTKPDLTILTIVCALLAAALLASWATLAWWRRDLCCARPPRPPPALTSRLVRVSHFPEYVRAMLSTKPDKFHEEFEELRKVGQEQPCTAADLPCNQHKNRFTNILPYDHSRFKLEHVEDEEGSDYINASYVPAYNSPRGFIASQGPLASTRDHFWRMCWLSNASSIVMLTRCVENNEDKCDHYWPHDGNTVHYADVAVTVLEVSPLADWTISELLLCKGEEKRVINHFQFSSWPDFGVPEPPSLLVRFVQDFRKRVRLDHRPVLVHCSAGVGRTGTFIALDRIIQQLLHRAEYVDIFGLVYEMRRARMLLVQTRLQYACIHVCIAGVLSAVAEEHERRASLPPPPPHATNVHYNDAFQECRACSPAAPTAPTRSVSAAAPRRRPPSITRAILDPYPSRAAVEKTVHPRERGTGVVECANTSKTESARQAGPALRASGRTSVVPPSKRRWVPPSLLHQDAPEEDDAKHDIIFRRVRGILNKLTPEKFKKLSDDLLGLELDSSKVLRGVILLIFDKALDEPKYSSMYAQLCKRLSEEAPNFEPPDKPCTFRLLLLNKCRSEFENRASAFEALDGKKLSPEDEERRKVAKRKMLGNIKFIGELGKLEILAESILHRCIQQLLAWRAGAEHNEDLECLAQLVRTCGRVLDSERGRGLVDQYFARIETLAGNAELAPRIRFMLCDVTELRRSRWVPRAAVSSEGPVPIQQLRPDDDFSSRRSDPPAAPDPLFRHGLRTRSGLNDMLSGLSLGPSSNMVPPPGADKFGFGGNGFGGGSGRDNFRNRGQGFGYNQRNQPGQFNKHPQSNSNNNAKDVAPRFKGRILATPCAMEDLQMRPAAHSLLFTANKMSKPQNTLMPLSNSMQSNVLAPAFASSPSLLKEPAITIKPAQDKNAKPKKDKGPNKEELLKTVLEVTSEACAECAECAQPDDGQQLNNNEEPPRLAAQLDRLRVLALNDKLLRLAIISILGHSLQTESSVWVCVSLVRGIKRGSVLESLKATVGAQHPHPRLPALLAHVVLQKLCSLGEVSSITENGQHYPLLLELLQELKAMLGQEKLLEMYNESKVNLATSLPAEASLAEAVESRGLSALVPQLRVQAELARELAADPSPQHLYRWIKANVDVPVRQNAAFVSSLLTLLVQYITQEAESGCATAAPDKAALEKEKVLVAQYAPLLTAVLSGGPALQLAAVYAVQVHAHTASYPKGMLLRWFMYLYNMEVCEEEAFLRWREDVNDAYPGKGEALFQVNAWLTWLQQQESDEDDADD